MSEDGVEEHKILISYIFANFSQNMENKINNKIYCFFSLLLFRYVSIKDFLSDVLFTSSRCFFRLSICSDLYTKPNALVINSAYDFPLLSN